MALYMYVQQDFLVLCVQGFKRFSFIVLGDRNEFQITIVENGQSTFTKYLYGRCRGQLAHYNSSHHDRFSSCYIMRLAGIDFQLYIASSVTCVRYAVNLCNNVSNYISQRIYIHVYIYMKLVNTSERSEIISTCKFSIYAPANR